MRIQVIFSREKISRGRRGGMSKRSDLTRNRSQAKKARRKKTERMRKAMMSVEDNRT